MTGQLLRDEHPLGGRADAPGQPAVEAEHGPASCAGTGRSDAPVGRRADGDLRDDEPRRDGASDDHDLADHERADHERADHERADDAFDGGACDGHELDDEPEPRGEPGCGAGALMNDGRSVLDDAERRPPAADVAGPPPFFDALVAAEAYGAATEAEIAVLWAHADAWVTALHRLLAETEASLRSVRHLEGPERAQVVADFEDERATVVAAIARLTGVDLDAQRAGTDTHDGRDHEQNRDGHDAGDRGHDAAERDGAGEADEELVAEPGVVRLQLSWTPGRVVAWAGGPRVESPGLDELRELLAAAGAPAAGWLDHVPVPLPGGQRAAALSTPLSDVLGWLVAIGTEPADLPVGPTVRWLGRVAGLAVRLTAQGRVVPTLQRRRDRSANGKAAPSKTPGGKDETGVFSVHWSPVLVDPAELEQLGAGLPGALTAADAGSSAAGPAGSAANVTRAVLADVVDAICHTAARRVEVPAPPPQPRTVGETAEVLLARLDGTPFAAPTRAGSELIGRLERWARPLGSASPVRLVVELSAPDAHGAWLLQVLASGLERHPIPLQRALASPAEDRRRAVLHHLTRLERMVPALLRPGGNRRGEVVLAADEAWELMTTTGAALTAAGYDVRVPALSRRRPLAALRLVAEPSSPSVVGAHQLADVRWTVAFGDVELGPAELARLAAQARPLIRAHGRWVALDHADLAEAAAALAERENVTRMSGAAVLRHALGLEGSGLPGGITLGGSSWASELLHRAADVPAQPMAAPPGFVGKLRSYQEEALAWMSFLDGAGLGGCLALDMGLGKTPTLLAHLQAGSGSGPSLVVAPPAVVGNWAAEAEKFTPDLRVVVHHGAGRASSDELADIARDADVVLTTYATAVRDVDALATIDWARLVFDEAQTIKNSASETAQQVRRLPARSKLALTGTPIENGLGDLWAILDVTNPGLVGPRAQFVAQLSREGDAQGSAEAALRALNGLLVFRRTKAEPLIAAELPERIDQLDHCTMTTEQIGLYQAVLDELVSEVGPDGVEAALGGGEPRKGRVLAAITALKQICDHPTAYTRDDQPLAGRSGKLARLEEIVDAVFDAGERVLVFTHFAEWGQKLADYLTAHTGRVVECYHGGLSRTARDRMVADFQHGTGPGALVLSLKAGGTGLNLTAASHVVLYDRWWNPAVEDQARDRAWRIGQTRTVVSHRLVCPGTVDERVEEVVSGKRRIADLVLPKSSSLGDLDADQLRLALGLRPGAVLTDDATAGGDEREDAA